MPSGESVTITDDTLLTGVVHSVEDLEGDPQGVRTPLMVGVANFNNRGCMLLNVSGVELA